MDANGDAQCILSINRSGLTAKRFRMIGGTSAAALAYASSGGTINNTVFEDINVISSGGKGVSMGYGSATSTFSAASTGCAIRRVTTTDTNEHGISIAGRYDGATIEDSTAARAGLTGNFWGIYQSGRWDKTVTADAAWSSVSGDIYSYDMGAAFEPPYLYVAGVSYAKQTWNTDAATTLTAEKQYTFNGNTAYVRMPSGVSANSKTINLVYYENESGVIEGCSGHDTRGSDGVGLGFDHGSLDPKIARCSANNTPKGFSLGNIRGDGIIEHSASADCTVAGTVISSLNGTATVRFVASRDCPAFLVPSYTPSGQGTITITDSLSDDTELVSNGASWDGTLTAAARTLCRARGDATLGTGGIEKSPQLDKGNAPMIADGHGAGTKYWTTPVPTDLAGEDLNDPPDIGAVARQTPMRYRWEPATSRYVAAPRGQARHLLLGGGAVPPNFPEGL